MPESTRYECIECGTHYSMIEDGATIANTKMLRCSTCADKTLHALLTVNGHPTLIPEHSVPDVIRAAESVKREQISEENDGVSTYDRETIVEYSATMIIDAFEGVKNAHGSDSEFVWEAFERVEQIAILLFNMAKELK